MYKRQTLLPALIMLVLFLVLAFIVPVVALRLLNNRSVDVYKRQVYGMGYMWIGGAPK